MLRPNEKKKTVLFFLKYSILTLQFHNPLLAPPSNPLSHKRKEVVLFSDESALCDSHAATDPCCNLISSQCVSIGPVAQHHASMQAQWEAASWRSLAAADLFNQEPENTYHTWAATGWQELLTGWNINPNTFRNISFEINLFMWETSVNNSNKSLGEWQG